MFYLPFVLSICSFFFFFFNDTATTEIYTLSLHDALPISHASHSGRRPGMGQLVGPFRRDRKSTRLNSSHLGISYAVFCLKKKKKPKKKAYTKTKKQKPPQKERKRQAR